MRMNRKKGAKKAQEKKACRDVNTKAEREALADRKWHHTRSVQLLREPLICRT